MRFLLALVPLLLVGLACELSGSTVDAPAPGVGSLSPTLSSQDGLVVSTPDAPLAGTAAAGVPALERDSFDLESLAAGLASLDSYRLSMSLQFEGVGATGAPADWRLASERIVTSQPSASRFDLAAEGMAASAALSAMSVVRIGSESFLAIPGIGCVSGAAADVLAPAGGLADPDALLAGLSGATWVADDQNVNGVVSRHYQFDRRAVPAMRERSLEVAGNIFVAEDGGYVTRVTMTATGGNDLLSPGNMQEGTLTLELNVSDVNLPLDVQLPEACAASSAYPVAGDAFELTNLGDLVSYKTRQSLDDVVAFYQEQMPAAGWSPIGEADIFADAAILTFGRDGAVITVNVDPDPEAGVVVVLISP